ncbi:unnamed protein product [Acanthoscelides obtectus]|uniref:Uncharacterized protein n=1 Tax=Acanthoscelides obtectus TaxID=200917 RepID=A0A9P0KXK5_ACAOB|nr:unnamed protein product [Acanthoscelides obtectus]CAH1984500.1 unnamed protein product [Acanthoscelides obtectus]CAK1650573.1 hypothetical protein AOBTE_LOCUS16814 [Acanthoscelides obtectus]CAK1650581.1 hypothetical protein AOBTE_LOCUS16818 [Acanthoscelides obtectus]
MVQIFSFPSLCWHLHKSKIRKLLNCVDMLLQFQIYFFIRTTILLGADHHQEITFCEIVPAPKIF